MIFKTQFEEKYTQIEGQMTAFALKLTRNMEDARDLKQETLCKAYEKLHTFKEGTNFKGWMNTILYNTFINLYRKKKKRRKVLKPVDDFLFATESQTIDGNAYNNIMLKEIKEMINRLTDTCRIPFKLFLEGYRYKEISDQLDIPMGTVKSRINFARKSLQTKILSAYGSNVRRA
ncbi:MAG: RNA polymerase sigma factor [Bacteroidota bacterium]